MARCAHVRPSPWLRSPWRVWVRAVAACPISSVRCSERTTRRSHRLRPTGSRPLARPAPSPMALRSGAANFRKPIWPRRAAPRLICLRPAAKDTSAPWQNPDTGARGMVTPITAAYTQDGFTCRDFLASVVRDTGRNLAAGRSVPGSPRQVGGPHHETVEARLNDHSAPDSAVNALRYRPEIPTLSPNGELPAGLLLAD